MKQVTFLLSVVAMHAAVRTLTVWQRLRS